MRPWTTRTVKAAVVAAGFAAVGTGAAAAAESIDLPKPDLSSFPDNIGVRAPLNTCQLQNGPGYSPTKAPCADTQVYANTPNMVKKVGADITTTARGIGGELRDGRPVLAPGKPNQVLGHVFAETTRVAQMTKTRPTIGGSVAPDHLGVASERIPGATLLDTEVGPREPGHQGMSTLDTAVDLTAAQGYATEPLANPVGAAASALQRNLLQNSGEQVALPQPEKLVPAIEKTQVASELDGGATDVAQQVTGSLPKAPVHRITGQLPSVGDVARALR
ncbi:hypothetical protein SAMN05216215_103110 [Saccharopolyspora shandongensis]|uniref:Uncharacterized protein n=1 Tax=Saccharopolyspora shandongensis TaxID=418495 RepID=A0A1H3LBW9_9PSEU|nr:hypothetical protein SAMN05216215_103110 [Saccharopolyspora shandongensis]